VTLLSIGGTISDQQNGFGALAVKMEILHSEEPHGDGVCLVNKDGDVVQFLHYGGISYLFFVCLFLK